MNIFRNIIAISLTSILCVSCTTLRTSKHQQYQQILSDCISKADSIEIPIPSFEERTIIRDDEIRDLINMIEIEQADAGECFCGVGLTIYFMQGTNELAAIKFKHDAQTLRWNEGKWPTPTASLTKQATQYFQQLFDHLQRESGHPAGDWRNRGLIKRPTLPLEPLSQERLNQMHECEMKNSQQ